MTKILSYLKYRLQLILFYAVAVAITLAVQYLANQEMLYARYTVLLMSFFLLVILLIDGARYLRRLKAVRSLSERITRAVNELPQPANALEAGYTELIEELSVAYDSTKKRLSAAQNGSLEYYTLWVHQIKTPIAALRLVLQKMEGENAGVIRQELFKIEQYADLALRYVKLSDISADLVIEECSLNDIVRESVKKFGVLFIYQKLAIDIETGGGKVTSDKRWLGFILEQILSNAIKYTQKGGIRIYTHNGTLVIEDSGIGIRPEDLPRIFEKGYTGYNGRLDNRASGIGLYLAKKAADALNIRISVQSKPGAGTKVSLVFNNADTQIFQEPLIK